CGRPLRTLARARHLERRRRARPSPLRSGRARRRRAPSAAPALPRPLATRRPGRLSRSFVGAVSPVPPLRRVSIQGYRAARGLALLAGMERLYASNLRHFVLLIEEPELYLSPHAQRHLYGLLRALAQAGNQILYSTHAPVFLSVDKLEELALVRHTPTGGTSLFQPQPLAEAESFRALPES